MKLSLDLKTSLTQTLTPQQIQYLKLLQLPVVQLEQQVMQEIEQNPMLEEVSEGEVLRDTKEVYEDSDDFEPVAVESREYDDHEETQEYDNERAFIPEQGDPFEFHKLIWQDDSDYYLKGKSNNFDDEEGEPFQIKDVTSFTEDLMSQIRLLNLSPEEAIISEQIIGNIDTDGYLRRDLSEIVDETNALIAEINYEIHKQQELEADQGNHNKHDNPARQFSLSSESASLLHKVFSSYPEFLLKIKDRESFIKYFAGKDNDKVDALNPVNQEQAEKVLIQIQQLDPPGVGSRSIQECLVAQCRAIPHPNAAQKLALEILTKSYDAFAKKHYHIIKKQLEVEDDYLREAIDVIRRLNPKPGGGETQIELNTVVPDFIIESDEETGELMITVNDSRIPAIRLSKAYEKLKKETQYKLSNKETKEWIRNKYEDAKFLIQAIRQRKSTMLKVMTSIAELQKDFFHYGQSALRPLIYKDIAENTGLDISTVCRIVNGKYVQTQFGTYELKYFFSESLPTDEGEEVSTRVIKQIIRDIIAAEPKNKPLSDDRICKDLKDKGYNVARRTVAKYREQMKIPVARLRKEL